MDNSSENTLDNTSSSVEVRPFSVGAVLRAERERLGLSLADIESRLKFASRQIEALEADNFTRLPEISFVRRFVRSYAKLLQLDPDPLLVSLPLEPAQSSLHTANVAIDVPFPNIYATRRTNIIWLSIGLVVIAITLLLFIWLNRGLPIMQQVTMETTELPTIMPIPLTAVSPSDALAASSKTVTATNKQSASIRLKFDADSWVKITDSGGTILLSQLNSSGSEQHLTGKAPFSVIIGNINGVHLYYQGKLVELAPFKNGETARLTLE